MLKELWRKVVATAKRPQRVLGVSNKERLLASVMSMRPREWRQADIPRFQRRVYGSYGDYLRHQAAKLETRI